MSRLDRIFRPGLAAVRVVIPSRERDLLRTRCLGRAVRELREAVACRYRTARRAERQRERLRRPVCIDRRVLDRLIPVVRARAVCVVVLRAQAARRCVVAVEVIAALRRHRHAVRRHRRAVRRRHARRAVRRALSVERHRVVVARPRRRVRAVARAALRDRHRHRRAGQVRADPAVERPAFLRRVRQREGLGCDVEFSRVRDAAFAHAVVVRDRVLDRAPIRRQRARARAVRERTARARVAVRRVAAVAARRPACERVAGSRRRSDHFARLVFTRVRRLARDAREDTAVRVDLQVEARDRPLRLQRNVAPLARDLRRGRDLRADCAPVAARDLHGPAREVVARSRRRAHRHVCLIRVVHQVCLRVAAVLVVVNGVVLRRPGRGVAARAHFARSERHVRRRCAEARTRPACKRVAFLRRVQQRERRRLDRERRPVRSADRSVVQNVRDMVFRRRPFRIQDRVVVVLVPDMRAGAVCVVVFRAVAAGLREVAAERIASARRHFRRRHRSVIRRRHARVARHGRIARRVPVERHRVRVRRPRRVVFAVPRRALRHRYRQRRAGQARARPARERVARSARRVQRERRRLDGVCRRVRLVAARQRTAVCVVADLVADRRPRGRVAARAEAARRDRHVDRRRRKACARPACERVAASRRVVQRDRLARHRVRARVVLSVRKGAALEVVADIVCHHVPFRRQIGVRRDVHRVILADDVAVRLLPAAEVVAVLHRICRPALVLARVLRAVRRVVRHRLRLVVCRREAVVRVRQRAAVQLERHLERLRREHRLQRHVTVLALHARAEAVRRCRRPVARVRLRLPPAERVARSARARQRARRRDLVRHRVRRACRQRSAVGRHVKRDPVADRRPHRLQCDVAPAAFQ